MGGLSTGLKSKLHISPVETSTSGIRTVLSSGGFEVLINPSGYQQNRHIHYSKASTLGAPAGRLKFNKIAPEALTLPQMVFDGTGVVELYGMRSVSDLIKKLLKLIYLVDGKKHEPNLVCFQWGDMDFIGRVTHVDIDYTLFKPSGEPLRAKVTLRVLSDMTVEESMQRANLSSPDLSHLVEVRAGDTLPLLCERIYRNPGYYMAIAGINGLVNFRDLKPGTQLRFPPLR